MDKVCTSRHFRLASPPLESYVGVTCSTYSTVL